MVELKTLQDNPLNRIISLNLGKINFKGEKKELNSLKTEETLDGINLDLAKESFSNFISNEIKEESNELSSENFLTENTISENTIHSDKLNKSSKISFGSRDSSQSFLEAIMDVAVMPIVGMPIYNEGKEKNQIDRTEYYNTLCSFDSTELLISKKKETNNLKYDRTVRQYLKDTTYETIRDNPDSLVHRSSIFLAIIHGANSETCNKYQEVTTDLMEISKSMIEKVEKDADFLKDIKPVFYCIPGTQIGLAAETAINFLTKKIKTRLENQFRLCITNIACHKMLQDDIADPTSLSNFQKKKYLNEAMTTFNKIQKKDAAGHGCWQDLKP